MLTAAQKRAKQKYREKNRERTNYLNDKREKCNERRGSVRSLSSKDVVYM